MEKTVIEKYRSSRPLRLYFIISLALIALCLLMLLPPVGSAVYGGIYKPLTDIFFRLFGSRFEDGDIAFLGKSVEFVQKYYCSSQFFTGLVACVIIWVASVFFFVSYSLCGEERLFMFERVVFAIVTVLCFTCFYHSDILNTAGSAFTFLNGHILDFYKVNADLGYYDIYMPGVYILFAIWNIPLYILGYGRTLVPFTQMSYPYPVYLWFKLLPALCYFLSSFIIREIMIEVGFSERKSRLAQIVWIACPLGFLSQFTHGQYDIFALFFALLGFLSYLRRHDKRFLLFFTIAVTFKYFALLYFMPMLLLREKNFFKAALKTIIVFILNVPMLLNQGYGAGYVEFMARNSLIARVLYPHMVMGHGGADIPVIPVLFILLFIYIFFFEKEVPNKDGSFSQVVCYANFANFAMFGFLFWHPQWLLYATPFLVFTIFLSNDKRSTVILEILLAVFYTVCKIASFSVDGGQHMLAGGLFGPWLQDIDVYFPMKMQFLWIAPFAPVLLALVFFFIFYINRDLAHGGSDWERAALDDVPLGLLRGYAFSGTMLFLTAAACTLIMTLLLRQVG
ncbi:MAG: hypothetical protein IJU95_00145 [Treponema sp.]|nr:hypothetical protein [Treponema sp.]